MRILAMATGLPVAACNATYAADNDGAAVKTTPPDYEKFGEWNKATMFPEDEIVDDWVRRWMDRDRTAPFDLQVERTFGRFDDPSFSDPFASGQEFPPSDMDSVGGIPIGGFPPRQ